MVREGYILYLKTWLWESPKSSVKQHQEEGEAHSDVQRLVLGSSSDEPSESLKVAKSAVEDEPSKRELASHQKKLTRKCNQVVMIGV